MKIAIMQPYFMPYLGYWQLINAVDKFVVYDNIEYTKKGWINRNRVLCNGEAKYVTVPLCKDPDHFHVYERTCAPCWEDKMMKRVGEYYRKAPNRDEMLEILYNSIYINQNGLFPLLFNSIFVVMQYLSIATPLVISSHLPINHSLRGKEKVITICDILEATHYMNPIGGKTLYSPEFFAAKEIKLTFLKAKLTPYQQNCAFVPGLSILDIIAWNSRQKCIDMLNDFTEE